MLQANLIGYLGSEAEVKTANGKEFLTFRVANTDRWTDQAGQQHENTIWVDCIMNGSPAVKDFLKRGTMVYVTGSINLRVYSSPKDKCMKAGMTINVNKVELLGGKSDEIPSRLYRNDNGQMVEVSKYYGIAEFFDPEVEHEPMALTDGRGGEYVVDKLGWVSKVVPSTPEG